MDAWLMLSTVLLGAGRNLLSRRISGVPFGQRGFFLRQGIIFAAGFGALIGFAGKGPSLPTAGMALVYAALLLSAQWGYTSALAALPVGLCSTVYAMGFILPTLSGAIFWGEPFALREALGLMLVIGAILLSRQPVPGENPQHRRAAWCTLMLAMCASGGLGLMQKIHQRTPFGEEGGSFMALAFALAAVSFLCAACSRKSSGEKRGILPAALAGLCFGGCNLLNTTLAGRLDSAVFFPIQNIGVMGCTIVSGWLICRERLTRRDALVLLLAIGAVMLLR